MVQSVERLKLLTILTTADIRAVGPGVWNGWKAQLLRTLYYETEPVLTGGFSEVNRAQRVAMAQAEFRAELKDWTPAESSTPISRGTIRPIGSRSICRRRSRMRASCAPPQQAGKTLATTRLVPEARGVTELTVLAPDHPWLLSIIAGACAVAGANIVDAQIFTTTDGRALDTISVSREFEHDEDEVRRAARIADSIEKALRGDLQAAGGRRQARRRKGADQGVRGGAGGDDQQSVVEPLHHDRGDRPRPARPALRADRDACRSSTSTSRSAHVATFGERVVDVFYVTDLFGAKITSPTRQAAIKRALLALFTPQVRGREAARAPRGARAAGRLIASVNCGPQTAPVTPP